ncbi:MAG: fluoride exporter [Frankiales bacterium]|nr:fluoride exporter [Frankiales bacterium]
MTDPDAAPRLALPLVLVAAGGVGGSLTRYGLVEAFPHLVTTLVINVVGAFLLGVLVARHPAGHWSRPLLGTGFLGGFTTMSALAVQTVTSDFAAAVGYLVASLVLGVAAALVGLRA